MKLKFLSVIAAVFACLTISESNAGFLDSIKTAFSDATGIKISTCAKSCSAFSCGRGINNCLGCLWTAEVKADRSVTSMPETDKIDLIIGAVSDKAPKCLQKFCDARKNEGSTAKVSTKVRGRAHVVASIHYDQLCLSGDDETLQNAEDEEEYYEEEAEGDNPEWNG